MRRFAVRRALVGVCAAAALLVLGVGTASAQQFHGIAFTKGCQPNTAIGAPYSCAYQILNVVDQGQDTLQVTGLVDVVHSAGGDVNSGNILGALQLVFSAPTVSCTGGSGAGTAGSPYVGAASCTLPFGTSIQTTTHSFYTVQPGDFQLPNHSLTDSATLNWNNTCTSPTVQNCTTGVQQASAGSSTLVQQLPSSAATDIHNAQGQTVTAVGVGTTVHDFVTVTGQGGQPDPTGNVNIDWFTNGTCTAPLAVNSGSIGPLVPGPPPTSTFDATGFSFTVNNPGQFAFRAHYEGDGVYLPSDGPCEPLTVVDANIQISPQQATNQINAIHTLTGHVNVNDGLGGGYVNAPDGTMISFSIVSGPGTFVGSNTCTTTGGTGSCTVQITSASTGTTVVNATTNVSVGGVSLTRSTGDTNAGDSPNASKTWVAAFISIAPTAVNEVGTPHTFTVTVVQDPGTGVLQLAPNVPVTVTCNPHNGAAPSGPFNGTTNASGTFLVTVNSQTTGSLTCHASATVTLGNPPTTFTISTDGVAPDSGDATKTWVDANIQITPATATNVVNTNHTLTGHVNVDSGNGAGLVPAPDGTVISFSILSGPGSFVGGVNTCATAGGTGSCTVAITSATTGTTVIRDTTTVDVLGVLVTRSSGDAHAGDSIDAQKLWIAPDANIQISPATATNAVGTNHTLTGHVNVNPTGAGFVNAPDGTVINFSIVSGPGNFVGPTSCTTPGAGAPGSGSCTVVITSSSVGATVVRAATNVTVSGVVLHRETNDGLPGDSPDAQKNWVDANINITPAIANNAVGANHVLTITVNALGGLIDAGPHTATATIISGPGSFVGPNSCTYTGGAATASCTVTITSAVVGTTVVQATSDIPVNGVTITRTTGTAANTASGGSGNASKNWVDANIVISPATANNAVGANHVLTITVNALGGLIDAGPHTATATIVSGPGSFVGSPTCTYTGGAPTASCTVTITSATVGTTVVSATSNIPVNGVTITRTTGTAANTASGGSGNAAKNWVDANISITPANATNPVGTNHVLTITVNALGGTIDAGLHTATAMILSGPGSFVGGNTCTYTGGAATASCTVTITSAVPGTTVVQATSDIPVSGVTITRTTGTAANTASGGSGNASKVWLQPDANIQISPATATNPVGANHVLTCHINVSADGTTFTNAPDGTVCTVSIISGPGAPATQNCTVSGGGGNCTVTITSAVTGTSVIRASTNVTVNGIVLHRETNDGHPGDSVDAQKNWVDANIQISPPTATNAIGSNHVLTITVNALGGTIDAGPHTATASIVSGPGSFVGSPTCTYTGGAATATCTVTITSATPGTTVVQATSNIPVSGIVITRTTNTAVNTASGGSGNANKTWVDANIQITPATASNPTGTNHTLTGHVNVNPGTGFVNAPDGTTITFSLTNAGGATATFVGPSTCTTAGGTGSCTVVISSPTGGTTTINASSTVTVGGVSLTRTTNGTAGNSGPATKTWIPPGGQITPTNVDCSQIRDGTAPTLDAINYPGKNGLIGQGINPGVFFYWTKITVPAGTTSVTVSQSVAGNAALFQIHQGWIRIYSADCSSYTTGTQNAGGTGGTFSVTPGQSYIIGIKYDPKSIAGTPVPVPATVVYTFTTSLGATTSAKVTLKPN
jgi:hypothetical protein